eukprot:scaffold6362_cov123-Isochrysis_galbana.AAC.9
MGASTVIERCAQQGKPAAAAGGAGNLDTTRHPPLPSHGWLVDRTMLRRCSPYTPMPLLGGWTVLWA